MSSIDHLLGKIHQGDCIKFLKSLPDDSIDMIWTDPPYGHGNHDGDLNSQLNAHRGIEDKPIANDDMDSMRYVVDAMLTEAARVLKKECCCCCCCCGGGGPRPTFAWIANRMDTAGLQFFHSIIWDKVNPGLGWRFRRQHEMIMVAHRSGGKLLWADENIAIANVMKFSKERDCEHPNQKPVALVQRFIEAHTRPGQIVLDPFCGVGSTLVAAEKTGRKWIGVELAPKYCAIAQARINAERAQLKLF
jgi:site-specific DNA-methyltransferase (adenine-specific)